MTTLKEDSQRWGISLSTARKLRKLGTPLELDAPALLVWWRTNRNRIPRWLKQAARAFAEPEPAAPPVPPVAAGNVSSRSGNIAELLETVRKRVTLLLEEEQAALIEKRSEDAGTLRRHVESAITTQRMLEEKLPKILLAQQSVLERDEVASALTSAVSSFNTALGRFAATAAPLCAGKKEGPIKKILEDHIRRLRSQIVSELQALANEAAGADSQ